jgi:hypothetical protein
VAGVTLVEHGKPTTAAVTDEKTLPVDRSQYESGDAPCLEAFRSGKVVPVEAADAQERWP